MGSWRDGTWNWDFRFNGHSIEKEVVELHDKLKVLLTKVVPNEKEMYV